MNKYWYPFVTRRWDQDDVVFLNWGYEEDPPMGLPLAPEDEPNRYCIQLYHRTATQTDLSGKKVLEPSCGHGGGGAYLVKTLHPASYTGLDFNPDGVAFAKRRYDLPGLDFVHGDAENLPFPDESFDAVLNVEASHAYPHFDRFLSEMVRVLRPGGHFLYVDFRGFLEYDAWDAALAGLPLRMESKREINPDVLRGLDNNSGKYLDLVGSRLPVFLRPFGTAVRRCARHADVQGTAARTAVVPDVPLHQGLTPIGFSRSDPQIQASPVRNARGSPIEQTGGHCSPQDSVSVIYRSMPEA